MTEPRPVTKEDIICLGCKFATTYELAEGVKIGCNETRGLVLDADVVKFALQGLLDESKKNGVCSDWLDGKAHKLSCQCEEDKRLKKWLGAIQEERE